MNNNHTRWYPADQPDTGPPPPPERTLNNPFRFVNFGPGAPYPEHEGEEEHQQPYMIDMLSGEQWPRGGGKVRQPVAEDFLGLRSVPAQEHGNYQEYEQDGPEYVTDAIEPLPYIPTLPSSNHTYLTHPSDVGRHHSIATTKPQDTVKPDPVPKRSKSAADMPTQPPPMANDFFSPVLGGLQRLPSVQQKESKGQRLKRIFSFGKRRKYGRVPR